jgi:2,4-dienoyl-CoA reductase (NADPH2)
VSLLEPVRIGNRTAPNRLLFGPHETNLARGRAISDRHVAYYVRRARGGAGVIVTEEASVHDSDWPYERAPLATDCATGWRAVADAVHSTGAGTLVLAALGHAGGQGSSAYNQQPLLAPSRVPEVNSREVPKWMEADDIAAVVRGFGDAARLAVVSGMDGVEVNAGQHSLVRQFLSGLTNQRGDEWGTDRLKFARDVLEAVRAGLDSGVRGGAPAVLGLRLSCDELAPWAGMTPEMALGVAIELAPHVDYLVVVRGSIFTTSATRPDFHQPAGFNRELCAQIRSGLRAAGRDVPVVLQGSMVDARQAEEALADGECDLVEMTRAQIADAALGAKVAAGVPEQIRTCTLCNQLCQVRDARNPIVSCAIEPSSGHETDDPSPTPDGPLDPHPAAARNGRAVLVVGGGPAGLEAARVAAVLGHPVRLVERGRGDDGGGGWTNTAPRPGRSGRADRSGSEDDIEVALRTDRSPLPGEPGFERWQRVATVAHASGGRAAGGSPGTPFHDFTRDLVWECARLGVDLEVGDVDAADVRAAADRGEAVILATGSIDGLPAYALDARSRDRVRTAADLSSGNDTWDAIWERQGLPLENFHVVVLDPIGGPIGVAAAEEIADGATVHLVTQDNVAGNELARTGDLAPANVRLQQLGVVIERRSIPRSIGAPDADGRMPVVLEDRFSGARRTLHASFVIDAGFRLPDESLWLATGARHARAGDCVAPRTVHEAILEGRRAALAVHEGRTP